MDDVNLGDLVIRSCRQEDVAVLEQVSPSPGTSQFHLHRYGRQLAGEVIYLTAWLEGSPVGNLCLILGGPGNPQARDGLPPGPEINAFDVIPSHRDRGIGSALIAEAERRARNLGHLATVLGVEVNNDAAHRLYERLGYREWPHGVMRDSYSWTDDAGQEHEQEEVVVWMEKRLDVEN